VDRVREKDSVYNKPILYGSKDRILALSFVEISSAVNSKDNSFKICRNHPDKRPHSLHSNF